MTPGTRAAVEVARDLGLDPTGASLIQETNNTVVLLPEAHAVAKVATRARAAEWLVHEHAAATALVVAGASVAPPIAGTTPLRHEPTGYTVTLWQEVVRDTPSGVDLPAVGESLLSLHDALARCDLDLPPFSEALTDARAALDDDRLMVAIPPADRELLRAAFDALLPRLDGHAFAGKPLHGEPHEGNYLVSSGTVHWIDFESACVGPVEWDLALLPTEARTPFGSFDAGLVDLLEVLNSARVATWCWVQARHESMRRHGEHHVGLVRARYSQPTSIDSPASPIKNPGRRR